jgi:hypothetical protein
MILKTAKLYLQIPGVFYLSAPFNQQDTLKEIVREKAGNMKNTIGTLSFKSQMI